jgi:hypothetical protein
MKRRISWLSLCLAMSLVAAACGRGDDSGATATTTAPATTAATGSTAATTTSEVGVSETEITIEVMADTGSALAPGLFQGNIDALNAYAKYVNAKFGGVGCRKLVVKTWDSKLDPNESKNGLIDSCKNAVAMVGGNALFNPDVTPMTGCVDKAGTATGLPDIAALANDITEQCGKTTYVIQAVTETCPVTQGQPRTTTQIVGPTNYYLKSNPGLKGLFMVPGDLPTTVQSATFLIAAQQKSGIVFDAGTPKVSGRDEQSAFTPRVQALKATGGNFVYDGSNDVAMIKMRKEAKAQGLDSVKIWACSLACYTKNMTASGGADVEGTYVWMQFLPFEEADQNAELKAYVDSVTADGKAVDSFGAQAWQAAAAFKTVVDKIVAKSGPNGITRAAILTELAALKDFDANGWTGKKSLRGVSNCFLIMQIQGGKFVRSYPAEKGKMDCADTNLTTVTLDPKVEADKIK